MPSENRRPVWQGRSRSTTLSLATVEPRLNQRGAMLEFARHSDGECLW
jgi:hypothetical protein